ncbi:hypothetical protein LWI29_002170 [Acer saccharum]|uniref:SWIM-type domain-containing protein n=1 Tax=Acer saccharum TaxID=4024 RepID=A0AA39S5N8_ACESA|nr:hypothetical protein LWI29_002170 [Acer saccharum]
MTSVQLVLNWGGKWKSHHGQYWYEGQRAKAFDFPRDANYDLLLDKVYYVTGIDRDHYRVSMTTVAHTFRPSMPIEIVDDEDVALLLRRENVDPLVCISIEEIGNECPERNHKPPESSANPHHETREYEFHHTQKSNIQVTDIDEFQTSDVPHIGANLDDIVEGFTPTANIDTTSPHLIPDHDETEPQSNPIPNQFPNRYDEQFAHVQRLVPPPCAFYSIHSGEVAPRPITMRIEVGEVFPSKQQLQSQLGHYCLANQCQIRVFKSDTTRYQVRCIVEGCNWRMRAAKVQNSDHFQIRKFDNQHTCSTEARFSHQRQASARVIGEHIQEKLHDHRLYKPKEIINDMQREFGISCNYHKGYRARHIALEEVQGTPVESYSILPSYLYMLEQTNPGTITDFHTDSSDRFMYMFFCFKACIDGFLSSIRPVIAVDGTFLTGPHRGVLFVAVCMDGNEQIFPLAFGVGDSETNEAWEWFLSRLHKAVGEVDDLVIVSDRKNSIITGVEKVFPNSFHGACAIHLQRNMLGHYGKNKALKRYFERAARVYRESQFRQRMEQLANINSEAARYVTDAGFDRWSRAYSPRKRYNIMSTNIAESMNNAIKGCKELPITGVIDYIRGVLQGWFHDRRTAALKLTTQLTTAADVAVGVKDDEARYMRVYPITFYTFVVKDGDLDGHVDLTTKSCSCREFDVDQLPCAHALACIRLRGFSFPDYCSPYYSSTFLVTAYSGEIHPVGQPSEWLVPSDIASKIVHPPIGRRPPGRPRKNRNPSFGEEVTQRRCTTCHRVGHNSHTCTYPKSSTMGSTCEIGEASGSHNVL